MHFFLGALRVKFKSSMCKLICSIADWFECYQLLIFIFSMRLLNDQSPVGALGVITDYMLAGFFVQLPTYDDAWNYQI